MVRGKRNVSQKVELFSYLMQKGKDIDVDIDFEVLVALLVQLNTLAREYRKQMINIENREGSVNGKWYENTTTPFREKGRRIKFSMLDKVVDSDLYILHFWKDGTIFLLVNGIELDISYF